MPSHKISRPKETAPEIASSKKQWFPEVSKVEAKAPAGVVVMHGVRAVPMAGTVYEVTVECAGTAQNPQAPWKILFDIKSSMISKEKFNGGLKEFGLGEEDIQKIESRVALKKRFTGQYLTKDQQFSFSSDDGIDPIVLDKLAKGFKPSSGSYAVKPADSAVVKAAKAHGAAAAAAAMGAMSEGGVCGLAAENKTQAAVQRMVHGGAGVKSIEYSRAKSAQNSWAYGVNGQRKPTDPQVLEVIQQIKAQKSKFCDPDFDPATMPHADSVLQLMQHQPDAWCWMRPEEFISAKLPSKIGELLYGPTESPSYSTVEQGMVGDCWFISSLTTVAATQPSIIEMRFLEANPELGYYVLCFWKDGAWREVIVDDRMMILGGKTRGYAKTKLIYGAIVTAKDSTEPAPVLWLPLIEKAYAKLHGGYPFLEGGHLTYGARDLTGGCPLNIWKEQSHRTCSTVDNMFEWDDDMFYFVRKEIEARGILQLIGCSLHQEGQDVESESEVGLLVDHEYSVTRLIRVEGQPLLVEIRNPWGSDGEFTGDWSDSSSRWTPEMCKLAEYTPAGSEDGKFVMTFKDMQKYFDAWELNHLYSDSTFRSITRSAWEGSKAAGCGNVGGGKVYFLNPQFLVEVPEPPQPDMPCNVQFALTQEDVIWTRNERLDFHFIQMKLFQLSSDAHELSANGRLEKLRKGMQRETTGTYRPLRDISMVVPDLKPGLYVLVPSTFDPSCLSSIEITTWAGYPITVSEIGGQKQEVLTGL
eukprot:TRINITY_DN1881_c0_g1_i3.p1 TRINITY_DN1881_c0_g1~~TRINITY_DN1881_c0_g1_i3.p1  ORF type:complete len:753 (+),score=166.66 TRINITY_DN1881_c0_g1_i3:351-2609(+)